MSGPRLSIIPAGAVTDPALQPRDLQVLCLLGRHTDDAGWCRRSQVKMSREINCGRATLQRALERLYESGWVEMRPADKAAQAHCSHFYRVRLDVPDQERPRNAPETGGETASADDAEGVPIDGQGVPTGGQGCPPMSGHHITTPLNDPQRESAGASGQEAAPEAEHKPAESRPEDDTDFQALVKAWPAIDPPSRAWPKWLALSAGERAKALRRVSGYRAWQRAAKRSAMHSLSTYLGEKLFEQVPDPDDAPAAAASRVEIPARSHDWFAVLFALVAAGRDGDAGALRRARHMVAEGGLGRSAWVTLAEAPDEAARERLVKIERGSRQHSAWREHLAKASGLRLPEGALPPWFWVPEEWPPGTGALLEDGMRGGDGGEWR